MSNKLDVDLLLRTHDPTDRRNRVFIARELSDYCFPNGPQRGPAQVKVIPFYDSVAWARAKLLLRFQDFVRLLVGRAQEFSQADVFYALTIDKSRQDKAKGYLHLTPYT